MLFRSFDLLEKNIQDYELVFVDDGSTDGTTEIVENYAKSENRLKLIAYKPNKGIASAATQAFSAASKEFLFWQTVDWSYDLKNLRIFLELLKHFTIVKTVRPVPERILSHIPLIRSVYRVKTRSDTLAKAMISLGNYYLLRVLYGAAFHDFQGIYLCPTALIQSLQLTANSSFLGPQILFESHLRGASFIEVPARFMPRHTGEAKGTKWNAIMDSLLDLLGNLSRLGPRVHPFAKGSKPFRISRASEPFFLEEEVLRLIIPLLEEFRHVRNPRSL